MEDTINISLSFNKDELICCACQEPLTKQIYQCVNGNHYMCNTCEPKWQKDECPTCRHPGRLVRNILFEEQLKKHLTPCPNIGCCEKFFKWQSEHKCLFAPVKCRVCKREVAGNTESYCHHLEGFCDDMTFKSLKVSSFEKKLRYKPNSCSSVLKLPNKQLLIIRKSGHSYKISAVKDPDVELTDYRNIICTYTRGGIEYNVTVPITNLNETKIADIFFAENESAECIFSKDVQAKPKPPNPPSYSFGVTPTQRNLDETRMFDSLFGPLSYSGYGGNRQNVDASDSLFGPSIYPGYGGNRQNVDTSSLEALFRVLGTPRGNL
jgi:hypothetical protein